MFCRNCGNKLSGNFCSKCGFANNINYVKKDNKLKKVVLVMFLVSIILSLVVLILILTSNKQKEINTRTIMIFMAGNNLESDYGIASSDLASIDPTKIDLNKINILLYTGGTKHWFNTSISSDENAIFKLGNNGFEKIRTFDNKNLGDTETLEEFLNYSYENYKTDVYDLIFWDHGLGALGSVEDENTEDFLTPIEIKTALSKTNFNKKNKLETILFRTCLNATIEIASSLKDYGKYMIASEEVTIGSSDTSVLNFLNVINVSDNGIDYGIKYIESYKKQVSDIDSFNSTDSTYSIIDLNSLRDVENKINNFFSKINIKENYNNIARIRSNLHQYAADSTSTIDYDTIDLCELINSLKSYDTTTANTLLNSIKQTVVYNYSTNTSSNGISIYFPFNGSKEVKDAHLQLYRLLDFSNNYYTFIYNFNNIQNTPYASNFVLNFNENEIKEEKINDQKEFSMQLTDEQADNFASASYIIFKDVGDNYFSPIYVSSKDEAIYDEKLKTIKTSVTNNIITIYDTDDNIEKYIIVDALDSTKNIRKYKAQVFLLRKDEKSLIGVSQDLATIHISLDNNDKPYVTSILNEDGVALDINNYYKVDFWNFSYNILDENGNYTPNWESNPVNKGVEIDTKSMEFRKSSLDEENNYYCVFYIKDIKNNTYYSKLIKLR